MAPIKLRYCGECAIWQHNSGTCPYFKEPLDAQTCGCPKFSATTVTCEVCGGLTVPRAASIDMTNPDSPHTICANCEQHIGHCPTCQCANQCSFETDPSPLPKTVQQQIRQGNMISVTTVRNPERIRVTCQKGCQCFSEEFGCLRQFNSCGNYKIIYET